MPARRRTILLLLGALAAAAAGAGPASATGLPNDTPDAGNWTTDGRTNALVHVGDRVYIGGDFDVVGPRTGPFAAIDGDSGELDPALPYADGATAATIPDGDGGFYVGGAFAEIGDVERDGLAHVSADGAVDAAFAPQLDDAVTALALSPDGATLYVAGAFDEVGGVARQGVAALDAATGALLPGFDARLALDPDLGEAVSAIAADATSVYLGGIFSQAGGAARTNLAELDAGSGDATTWDPAPDGEVAALLRDGDTLYAAGSFYFVEGAYRQFAAGIDIGGADPSVNAFAPLPDGTVNAMAVDGSTVYLAGGFGTLGLSATPRQGAAAVAAADGSVVAGWDAQLNVQATATAIAVAGGRVYLGGSFTSVQSDPRTNLAQVSAADATLSDWAPIAGAGIETLTATVGGVVTGGTLDTLGGVRRTNLAALDAADGTPTDWAPTTDGFVLGLEAGPDGTIYPSGVFSTVNGQPRTSVAALDGDDGQLTAWDPQIGGGFVHDVAATADRILLTGDFAFVGPETRDRLAAVSPTTGEPLPWQANVTGTPTTIAVRGSTLYVGGGNALGATFSEVAGVERNSAAALDAGTALLLGWNPFGGLPRARPAGFEQIAIEGDTLVGVGPFEQVDDGSGAEDRGGAAVYDVADPAFEPELLDADARADGPIGQIGLHRGIAYVAGDFTALGGQPRDGVGAFDTATGAAQPWIPQGLLAQRLDVADDGTIWAAGDDVESDGRAGDIGSFSMAPAVLEAPAVVQSAPGTVSCARGEWDGTLPMRFSFSWSRDGATLPNVTASALPSSTRDGLACTVTAVNRGGTTTATASYQAPPVVTPPARGPQPPPANLTRPSVRPAPRPPRLVLPASATVAGGVATLPLRCVGTSGSCRGTLTLTARLRVAAARGSGRAGVRARRAAAADAVVAVTPTRGPARSRRGRSRARARRPAVRRVAVGSARYSLAAGRSVRVRVQLSRAARERLRTARRHRLSVTVSAAGGARRTLVLHAPPPPRRRR